MARLIRPNNNGQFGDANLIEYPIGLEKKQELVGGYIEYIRLDDGSILIMNEEGQLRGMHYNQRATKLLWDYHRASVNICRDISGPVILLDPQEAVIFNKE